MGQALGCGTYPLSLSKLQTFQGVGAYWPQGPSRSNVVTIKNIDIWEGHSIVPDPEQTFAGIIYYCCHNC